MPLGTGRCLAAVALALLAACTSQPSPRAEVPGAHGASKFGDQVALPAGQRSAVYDPVRRMIYVLTSLAEYTRSPFVVTQVSVVTGAATSKVLPWPGLGLGASPLLALSPAGVLWLAGNH